MDVATKPSQCLGRWLKVSIFADVTHCILRYDRTLLVTYCGHTVQWRDAHQSVMGIRHCVECEILHRRHERERSDHVASKR